MQSLTCTTTRAAPASSSRATSAAAASALPHTTPSLTHLRPSQPCPAARSRALQPSSLSPLQPRSKHGLPGRTPVTCQGLFGLGLPEVAVIAGIAAIVFGPSKLPEVGKGLGKTVKSFQTAAKEFEQELKQASAGDQQQEGQQLQEGAQQQMQQQQPQQGQQPQAQQQAPQQQQAAASGAPPPQQPPPNEERKKEPTA